MRTWWLLTESAAALSLMLRQLLTEIDQTKKADTQGAGFYTLRSIRMKLLHTFLGQTSALGRALSGFELRVGLANHIQGATTVDNLAISMTTFGGSKRRENFHEENGLERRD